MLWDQDRTELCVKLWNEGLSASLIARQLGGVSRNAVIGRLHRLGHARVGQTTVRLGYLSRGDRPKRKPRRAKRVHDWLTVASEGLSYRSKPVAATSLPPEPVRPATLFKLQDLEDNQCRFIYGDPKQPGSGYCGCEKAPGSSYCPAHHQVVFQAPAPRTKHADPTFKHWVKRASNLGYTRKEVVF